jgi:hypothetical protein
MKGFEKTGPHFIRDSNEWSGGVLGAEPADAWCLSSRSRFCISRIPVSRLARLSAFWHF